MDIVVFLPFIYICESTITRKEKVITDPSKIPQTVVLTRKSKGHLESEVSFVQVIFTHN